MKPETLAQIKSSLYTLYVAANKVADVWPHPITSISVLLQNASYGYETLSTVGHTEAEESLYKIKSAINAIAAHDNHHFVQYINDQMNMIIDGNVMGEDYDEDNLNAALEHFHDTYPDISDDMITEDNHEDFEDYPMSPLASDNM